MTTGQPRVSAGRDSLADLPPEELAAVLTAAASGDSRMIYEGYHTPEAFGLLRSESALQYYIDQLDEPLSPEWLDAFEALLDHPDYPTARLRGAALLLRYGRAAGFEYLKALAGEHGDLEAAEILVVARQEGAIGAVVDALLRAEDPSPARTRIVRELRGWDSPALDAALSTGDVRSRLGERIGQDPIELLSPAGRRGLAPDELATATSRWRETIASPNASPGRRAFAAAQLLRTQPGDPQATTFLGDDLAGAISSRRQLRRILGAVASSQDPSMETPVRRMLNTMTGPEQRPDRPDVDYGNTIAAAIETFVVLGGSPSEPEAQRWIDALGDHYSATSYVQRTYLALLNAKSSIARQRLAVLVGESEASRIEQIQLLTPLPHGPSHSYLPLTSRGWVWAVPLD